MSEVTFQLTQEKMEEFLEAGFTFKIKSVHDDKIVYDLYNPNGKKVMAKPINSYAKLSGIHLEREPE